MNGKGSARRPSRVSDAELAASWARTFRAFARDVVGVELTPAQEQQAFEWQPDPFDAGG